MVFVPNPINGQNQPHQLFESADDHGEHTEFPSKKRSISKSPEHFRKFDPNRSLRSRTKFFQSLGLNENLETEKNEEVFEYKQNEKTIENEKNEGKLENEKNEEKLEAKESEEKLEAEQSEENYENEKNEDISQKEQNEENFDIDFNEDTFMAETPETPPSSEEETEIEESRMSPDQPILKISDIDKFVAKNSNSEDENEPFVIGYEKNYEEGNFRLSLSTKKLLKMGGKSKFVYVDTAEDLNDFEVPIFLNGTLDVNGKFRLQNISFCWNDEEKDYKFHFESLFKNSIFTSKLVLSEKSNEKVQKGFIKAFQKQAKMEKLDSDSEFGIEILPVDDKPYHKWSNLTGFQWHMAFSQVLR